MFCLGRDSCHVDRSLSLLTSRPVQFSRGAKVEKMLTLAPERYTAGFRMVAKEILWCI